MCYKTEKILKDFFNYDDGAVEIVDGMHENMMLEEVKQNPDELPTFNI